MNWQTLTEYYENGRIRLQSMWDRNRPDGVIRGWYENGSRDFEIVIENGIRVKKTIWDTSGMAHTASVM